MMPASFPSRHSRSGFTFIENVFATGIVAVFFCALYALNSQCLYLLNSGRGAALAAQSLQERVEQLRNCTWAQITDANFLQASVMNSATNGTRNLGQGTEKVTINAYPTALSPAINVVRDNGIASITSSNALIAGSDMVRVDVVLTWTGAGKRARTEATTTVIARVNP